MLVANAVVDPDQPRLQVGENQMDDRQVLLGNLWITTLGNSEVLIAALTEASIVDPSRKSGGALHRLHCFCLEFDGACEVPRRVPTDWIIEPVDVSGYGSFSLAS